MEQDIQTQFAKASIPKMLIKMAIPFTLAQIVNVLYSVVDRAFISRIPGIGTDALSGIGYAMPIVTLMTALSSLVGAGGGPLLSISLGKKDKTDASELMGNSMTMLLLISAAMMGIVICAQEPILYAFGARDQSLVYASEYLGIYILGTLFVLLSMGMNQFISAMGYARVSMVSVLLGAGLNIILDPILIFVLDMGIRGAAMASVIAQGISAIWVVSFLWFGNTPVKLELRWMRLKAAQCMRILKMGFSTGSFYINESIVTVALNALLFRWGGADASLYVAAMTIVNSTLQIFYMPLTGIVRAAQPIVGYNLGRGDMGRIRQCVYWTRVCCLVCSFAYWALMMLLPRQVAMIFTPDPVLAEITTKAFRCTYFSVFIMGLQMTNQHAFVSMGNARLSFFFGVFRKVILLLGFAAVMPYFFGVYGIYAAEAVGNIVAVIVTHIVFSRYLDKIEAQLLNNR